MEAKNVYSVVETRASDALEWRACMWAQGLQRLCRYYKVAIMLPLNVEALPAIYPTVSFILSNPSLKKNVDLSKQLTQGRSRREGTVRNFDLNPSVRPFFYFENIG